MLRCQLRKLKILFLPFFFSFFIFNYTAYAQIAGIKVSPIRIEELVEPGDVVTKKIKVTNVADFAQTFFVYVMDFTATGEGGEAILYQPGVLEGPFLSSWIETTKEGINFAPGEEKEIAITFHVPKEAGPGGYYGAVVFGPRPPEINPAEGSVVSLAHQAAVLVLFHLLGEVDENARIREFASDKNIYSTPFQVKFITRIENLGNVHIKPVGSIKIVNMAGKEVANLSFNEIGSNVLPKTIRKYENTWEGNFGLGKYSAFLAINYGVPAHQGGKGIKTISSQVSFWIMPWNIVIPVLVGIIFLIAIFLLLVNLYKNRAVRIALQKAGVNYQLSQLPTTTFPALIYIFIILLILIIASIILGVIYFLFFA